MKIQQMIITLFFLGMVLYTNAQTKLMHNADAEVDAKNYTNAIHHYQKVLKNTEGEDKAILFKKIGFCFDQVNQYDAALSYYRKYLELENKVDKDFLFNYAELLLKSGEVNMALASFEELAKRTPENQEVIRMISSCNFALSELKKENLPLIGEQELINSTESEFGLSFFEGKLIFASQRFSDDYSSIHGRTNEGYSDLYIADFDTVYNVYSNPQLLSGRINTPLNEGTFAFNNTTNIAFFTQCEKNPELCRILKSRYEKNKWKTASPVSIGDEKYNYAHPCLTPDGKTMYFVSDMPGGFGGKDIWKASVLANGSVATPIHLGEEINTPKDEMFPKILGDSILLFASDGHIGMGGLDIFYSKRTDNIWDQPQNLGAPINSTSDDFGILLNPNLKGGYFCSNRNNAQKSDDIYAFYHNIFLSDISGQIVDSLTALPLANVKIAYSTSGTIEKIVYCDSNGCFTIPNSAHANCPDKHELILTKNGYQTKSVTVQCSSEKDCLITMFDGSGIHSVTGTVTDKLSSLPIEGAMVVIKSLKGINDTTYSVVDGKYSFQNIHSDDYLILRASKPNYLKDSKSLISPDNTKIVVMCETTNYDTDFDLYPIQLQVEFNIENIYYEFDKARLLPESKLSLKKLVNLLTENPGLKIRINSHTDSRGNDAYNLALSEKRGTSVLSFLIQENISPKRLNSQGLGETRLAIVDATTEEEHQKNRRTTFEILGNANVAENKIGTNSQLTYVDDKDDAWFNKFREKENKSKALSKDILLQQKMKSNVASSSSSKQVSTEENNYSGLRIQLMVVKHMVDINTEFRNIKKELESFKIYTVKVGEMYKYQLGNFKNRVEAERVKRLCQQKGFSDCFIVQ